MCFKMVSRCPMKMTFMALSIMLLASCAQPPKPLRGDFTATTPKGYVKSPVADLPIRWTGFVVAVENKSDHSCLTVLGKLADPYGKPSRRYRMDTGRFIACKPQFLDPEAMMKKPVTVVGQVKKVISKSIDQHPYPHPLVDAQVIYIW